MGGSFCCFTVECVLQVLLAVKLLTVFTVELDCVGAQLNGGSSLTGLGKSEVLHLAICAQYIYIQHCGAGVGGGWGGEEHMTAD